MVAAKDVWDKNDIVKVSTIYALNFLSPQISVMATKGCNSALIDDEIDVFYSLVMTSKALMCRHLFVLAQKVIISHLTAPTV